MDKKYREMSQKLSKVEEEIFNPEQEIKKAFTKMTDAQLNFHLQIPGKNHDYAKAILEHRKNKKI